MKVNSEYSTWSRIQTGVPQGSIIGPLLYNIYLSDLVLFFENKDIASYADDNTLYTDKDNMYQIIIELEENSKVLIDWINNNCMKANPDKFHILLSSSQNELNDNIATINIDNNIILNGGSENLLGITIDNKLTFKDDVSNLCKKASQKLHALATVSQKINHKFVHSIPLVWIFHSRKSNNRIHNIQERSLRIIYKDYTSTFDELLEKGSL